MYIDAVFKDGDTITYTRTLSQYDKGVRLRFLGIPLPENFEVHYSNAKEGGVATTVAGKNYTAGIPDAYLASGEYVYAWIYLYGTTEAGSYTVDTENQMVIYDEHGGEYTDLNKAATSYQIVIPVNRRPAPIKLPGTEEEGSYEYNINGENLIITEK